MPCSRGYTGYPQCDGGCLYNDSGARCPFWKGELPKSDASPTEPTEKVCESEAREWLWCPTCIASWFRHKGETLAKCPACGTELSEPRLGLR